MSGMGWTRLMRRGGRLLAGSFTSSSDNSSNIGVIMRSLLRASSIALATSLIFAGIAGAQAPAAASPTKIGYINSAQLLQQAPGRAEAEAQFDREVGVYRQQIQRMDDSLRTMMAAFDRDAPKLDSVTREARRTTIGQREIEYQGRA